MALTLYSNTVVGAPSRLKERLEMLKQLGGDTEENRKRVRVDAFNGDLLVDCMYELGSLEGQGRLRDFLSLSPKD